MGLPDGKPRQRAWRPKSTTGCITCKIRKVKCDEEKPHCKRCTSTGRKCDGYATSRSSTPNNTLPTGPPATGHIQSQGQTQDITQAQVGFIARRFPLPLACGPNFGTPEERSSFDFFFSCAIPALSGPFASPFWTRELLQAANMHSSIQHAVLALGAMHRRYLTGSSSHIPGNASDDQLQFALLQANQAIQELVKAGQGRKATKIDKITIMTTCVLFNCMACLQGHQHEALQHLKSGIKMLKEVDEEISQSMHWNQRPSGMQGHPVSVESLRAVLAGLDLQARCMLSMADLLTWESVPNPVSQMGEDAYSSLAEVQFHLEVLLKDCLAFLQDSVHFSPEQIHMAAHSFQRLQERFSKAEKLADAYFSSQSHVPDSDVCHIPLRLLLAETEYFLYVFKSESGFYPDSSSFDTGAHFANMMELITRFMSADKHTEISPSHKPPATSPIFTTAFGHIMTLWLVATRAPSDYASTQLRKQAICYLAKYPRREGFWDGPLAGRIAQEAMSIEEESAGMQRQADLCAVRGSQGESDIFVVPEVLRIRAVSIDYGYGKEREARIEFKIAKEIMEGKPGVVRWMNW